MNLTVNDMDRRVHHDYIWLVPISLRKFGVDLSGFSLWPSESRAVMKVNTQGTQMQLKEEFDILASDQCAELQPHKRLSLTSKTLCELICQLIRYSVKNKNPKLLGNILSIVLLIVDQRQLILIVSSEEITKVSSFLLCGCVNALILPREQLRVWPTEGSFENDPRATLSEDLKLLFHELSDILPGILPTSSGFSRQAIIFLNSKWLCIPWGCFGFDHLQDYEFSFKSATQSTTILPADSVLCAVSKSEDVEHIFSIRFGCH
jgi:hypothetical protein